MSTGRWMRELARETTCVALVLMGFGLACGDDASSEKLERDPSWLAACAASSECAIGQCVCGVCTEPCGVAPGADCSRAPAGAACFAQGSIAHSALCADSAVGGVCLPSCRLGDDCGDGFVCDVGACVPAASMGTTVGSATSQAYAESFPSSWPGVTPPEAGPARRCDGSAECPTLEALLRTDSCFEVMRGCGITYLNGHDGRNGPNLHYWYDAFGAPPRLRYDVRTGESVGSAEAACDAVEMACWTCETTQVPRPMALASVLCAELPGIWPVPPPALDARPGCACEPDGDGARVSLDCFCGLYPCPSQDELLSDWAASAAGNNEPNFLGGTLDTSARVWLSNARYSGQRYAFDAGGALVGAVAFSQGPATLPCNTEWVAAGPVREAERAERCDYDLTLACSEADWYPARP